MGDPAPPSSSFFFMMVAVALAAGIAAGTAATLSASVVPYAMSAAAAAVSQKRRKDPREARQRQKVEKTRRAVTVLSKEAAPYRDVIMRSLTPWRSIDTSFDNFPYYLPESTKTALLDSVYVHMRCPEYSKFAAELPALTPRLLLSGPPGTELYQEALAKAVAHHFKARFLVFDSTVVALEVADSLPSTLMGHKPPAMVPASAPAEQKQEGALVPATELAEAAAEPGADEGEGVRGMDAAQGANLDSLPSASASATPLACEAPPTMVVKDSGVVSGNRGAAAEPLGSHDLAVRTGLGQGERVKRPAAEAGVAVLPSSPRSPLARAAEAGPSRGQEAAGVLTDARRVLKKGDRVKYVGSGAGGGALGPFATVAGAPTGSGSVFFDGSGRRVVGPNDGYVTRGPPIGCKGRILMTFEENPNKVGVRFDKPIYGGNNLIDMCEDGHGFFCHVADLRLEGSSEDTDKLVADALLEVLSTEASKEPLVVFIRNVERTLLGNFERYMRLERLERTQSRVLVLGSHVTVEGRKDKAPAPPAAPAGSRNPPAALPPGLLDLSVLDHLAPRGADAGGDLRWDLPKASKMVSKLFPARLLLSAPQEEPQLQEWSRAIEADMESLRAEANRQRLRAVLNVANLECPGLAEVSVSAQLLGADAVGKVVGWAASHQLQSGGEPELKGNKMVINVASMRHGIDTLLTGAKLATGLKKRLRDVVPDNEFEKMLLNDVVPPDELGVGFESIGALENVKETLREVVMLPLQRPELFAKGQLTKPCRGLLLFGPPGTGKTMLAKAVATEAGANFINVSMSSIASKWFGEAEKYVKAVFTLASKIAPTVIFVDEVDSMLGRRGRESEHSAMRKLKNEFMSAWEGLRTREKERVLVMGATNRPFDLDDAVIRRFPRRLMVDLPDQANRAKILRVILAEEDKADDVDLDEIAAMSENYSGSDLRNLCTTAAYRRIREFLEAEKKKSGVAKDTEASESEGAAPAETPHLRPLSMEDLRQAMTMVRASLGDDTSSARELQQWNEQYGEGGSGKKETLSYFM